MVTTKEILIRARGLLEDPKHWNRSGHYAADAEGKCTEHWASNADKFCVMGAIKRSCYDLKAFSFDHEWNAADVLYDSSSDISRSGPTIVKFNDDIATHDQILKLFDNAIKYMDAKEVA